MGVNMKKIFFLILWLFAFNITSYACFDTYLFLKKASMVYPYRSIVMELNGEYSFTSFKDLSNDMFFSNINFYYGIARRISLQASLGSSEKPRGEFKLDTYGIRGVFNAYSSLNRSYTLDVIFEHRGMFTEKANEFEISAPSIFYNNDFTYVIHPTFSYLLESKDYQIGGHLGVFYELNEKSVIGLGYEYASIHSSSYLGQRLTESEQSASLFFGSYLGNRVYLQNELAKGISNSRDFGFALTTKIVLN